MTLTLKGGGATYAFIPFIPGIDPSIFGAFGFYSYSFIFGAFGPDKLPSRLGALGTVIAGFADGTFGSDPYSFWSLSMLSLSYL